ncbi:uncharacterized protein LOC131158482 [Malania oleifera]|uniref:uncharacterized protein LOC131158482 n=1 Tax=Malania oleifera TaxID=397392 RepID=UPI0025AE1714|nr:uncharacterized protein LOC131158482 [Malania oleifera]
MVEIAWSFREQGGPSVAWGCTIEKFTKMNPLVFSGGAYPTVAKNWMQEIEKVLMVWQCTNKQKVFYATYKLTSEDKRWWTATKLLEEQRLIPVAMTWSRFRKVFFDRYFPTTVRENKVVEFLNLTQGNLTVQQYAAKFIELSHFAPYMDEAKKARMFERGLKQEIFRQVVVLKVWDFSELVNRATVVEESVQRDAEVQSQRKRPMPLGFQAGSSRGSWRRDRYNGGHRQMTEHCGFQGEQIYPICPRCGRRHTGECRLGENICYQHGRPDHMTQSC